MKHTFNQILPAISVVGIEYAHIYSDQQFSKQHELGIAELHKLEIGPDITKIVLVDDYSPAPSSHCLDMDDFLQKLSQHNADPDAVVFESKLVPYCEAVMDSITSTRLKKKLYSYYRSRSKYPCSLFVAAWHLLRLRAFGTPLLECVSGSSEHLYTDKIITILPDSYMTPERRALEIIGSTDHAALRNDIQHVFFAHQDAGHSDFENFDVYEYSERNYAHKIRSADREIIDFVASTMSDMEIACGSLQRVADVGVGPNLYPGMLLSPFMADDGCLELIDVVPKNLDYVKQVLNGGDGEQLRTWKIYEDYIQKIYEGSIDQIELSQALTKLANISSTKCRSIFELEPNTYDAVLSFFVADSIVDTVGGFIRATESLMDALQPGGLFVAAHMVGSRGYFAGERTFFPAANLTLAKIEEVYNEYASFHSCMVMRDSEEAFRIGYQGMVTIVGKKFA